jgi:hypothetical protein
MSPTGHSVCLSIIDLQENTVVISWLTPQPNVASSSALQHQHPTDRHTQNDSPVRMENGELNSSPVSDGNVYSDQYHGQINNSIVGGASHTNHLQNIHVDVHVVNTPYPASKQCSVDILLEFADRRLFRPGTFKS